AIPVNPAFRIRLWVAVAGVFVVIVLGALVRGSAASRAFSDWPLMDGALLPAGFDNGRQLVHFLHRSGAALVGGTRVYLVVLVRRAVPHHRLLHRLAETVLALYLVQVLFGAANIWFRLHPAAVVGHVAFAALTWAGAFSLPTVGVLQARRRRR
ncbi:MAG: heme A synthase, partial [Acidimicrobiia bacterium]